jgi:hypothetical protein
LKPEEHCSEKNNQENLFPHIPQNFASGLIGLPHAVQTGDGEGTAITGVAGAGTLAGAP